MKAWHLLQLPWMGWSLRARRWVALAALAVTALVITASATSRHADTANLWLTHVLAIIDCLFWAFVLPRALLLANEAHRLRLPTLAREAIASLLLYAVLTIALPATLLAAWDGNGMVALTELALGAGIGMGYASLPLWLAFWAFLTPALSDYAYLWLPTPATDSSGFLHWASPLAMALWALIALNWRRAARCDDGTTRWFTPQVLRWRRLSTFGRNGAKLEAEMLRRRSPHWQPSIELRGVGPAKPALSLRVALGGWSAPQTMASRLHQCGQALLGTGFVVAVLAAMQYLAHDRTGLAIYSAMLAMLPSPTAIAFFLSLFAAMACFVRADALRMRWSRNNAELPLLALLPGLGDAAQARRHLLRASLGPTLLMQAVFLAVVLGLARWERLAAGDLALLLLALGSAMFATAALGVAALGGTALRSHWQSALTIAASILIITTSCAAIFRFGGKVLAEYAFAAPAFFALWAALIACLLILGRRGRHAYRKRPHPFLTIH